MSNYKTTICENLSCPNTLDSEEKGFTTYPSYCIDINTDKDSPFAGTPIYFCLPCAYKLEDPQVNIFTGLKRGGAN